MDRLQPSERSKLMAGIRSKDTKPELHVRRLLWSLGYRYRLHVHQLLGRPDVVFPRLRAVIFVHGCFWHQHKSCRRSLTPNSRVDYWIPKLRANVKRDRKTIAVLKELGWRSLVLWECEIEAGRTKTGLTISATLRKFLGPVRRSQRVTSCL